EIDRRIDAARDAKEIRIPPPMALRRLGDVGQPQRHAPGQSRLRHERAPLPLPPDAQGRSAGVNIRTILVAGFIVVISFIGASALLNVLSPSATSLQQGRPALVAVPPLKPLTGTSTVLAPAAIALSAIRDALDAQAPRNLSGKPQNPVSQLLSNAELNFNIARGPLTVTGRPDALVVVTPLTGQFQATGTIASGAHAVGNQISNLIGGSVGQAAQNLAGKAFDQHADIQGTVTTTSKPTIAPNWRLAPNLSAQVNVVDVILPIAGLKLSVAGQVKPFLENAVRS